MTIVCAGLLWFSYPDPSFAIYALVVFSIANISFEVSQVFYNAMLPTIVLNDKIGQLSGWGWGLGYIGGLACLVLLLTVFVQAKPPPLGLDTGQSEHVRSLDRSSRSGLHYFVCRCSYLSRMFPRGV